MFFYFCTYFLLLHNDSTVEYVQHVKNVKHVKHVTFVVANGRQREILMFCLDEVCASFILVLWYKLYGEKA